MANLDLNTLPLDEIELEDGQLVTDAILVIRSVLDGGRTQVDTLVTNGMDFVVGRGMISTAHDEVWDGDIFIPQAKEDEL